MFKKNKTDMNRSEVLNPPPLTAMQEQSKDIIPTEKELPREEKQSNTVIASGVRFEGNIYATGQIYVYGIVNGNIESEEGLVKIMRNGLVEGNIQSRDLVVDGNIKGQCRAESVDICENGRIDGILIYTNLSIKKGGIFTGQAEEHRPAKIEPNIIAMKKENVAEAIVTEKKIEKVSTTA